MHSRFYSPEAGRGGRRGEERKEKEERERASPDSIFLVSRDTGNLPECGSASLRASEAVLEYSQGGPSFHGT